MELYPSDLSDAEWAILEPLIPPEKPGGRARQVDMRAVLNAIFYVLRAGCVWRMLPREYPPRSTVYGYFAQYGYDGAKSANRLAEMAQKAKGWLAGETLTTEYPT